MDLTVAPYGRRAVVYDADNKRPAMIDLDSGLTATLPPYPETPFFKHDYQAPEFLDFCRDGRTYVQLTRISEHKAPAVCIKDLSTGAERFVPLATEAGMLRCCPDGRSAIVTLYDPANGAGIVQAIDLDRAEKGAELNVGVVKGLKSLGIHTNGPFVAVNVIRVVNGQTVCEIHLWDPHGNRRLAMIPGNIAIGWNCEGRLVAHQFAKSFDAMRADGMRWFDSSGNEISHCYPQSPGAGVPLRLSSTGRDLSDWDYSHVPAWRTWLQERFPQLPHAFDSEHIHVYDARTGKSRGTVTSIAPTQAIYLSPDGQTLAVSALDAILVWDIPPRKPAGGIVLGLMIVEVVLLIGWTAWRRRRNRKRRLVAS